MNRFKPTHLWTRPDGLKLEVIVDGGEIYDEDTAKRLNGPVPSAGIATVDGRDPRLVRVGAQLAGSLRLL